MEKVLYEKSDHNACALAVLLNALVLSAARAGEVIDRIVATVNGHIILQSDWNDALSL